MPKQTEMNEWRKEVAANLREHGNDLPPDVKHALVEKYVEMRMAETANATLPGPVAFLCILFVMLLILNACAGLVWVLIWICHRISELYT